jgi:hypothetical protein
VWQNEVEKLFLKYTKRKNNNYPERPAQGKNLMINKILEIHNSNSNNNNSTIGYLILFIQQEK